jgi:hypothetical protein
MGRLNHDQGQLFYSFCLEDADRGPHNFFLDGDLDEVSRKDAMITG